MTEREDLEIARETLAQVAPGGSKRWTDAQRLEDAIRVIARDEIERLRVAETPSTLKQ